MDRSPSGDLGNRVSFYIDESLQSVYGISNDNIPGRGRDRRSRSGGLRRQASAESANRRQSTRGGDARRLRRHVSEASAMEKPKLSRHGSGGGGGRNGRGSSRRITRHESDMRRPPPSRRPSQRTTGGSFRGSVYQVSPSLDVRRQGSQRGARGDGEVAGKRSPKGLPRVPKEPMDPEALAEEEKALAKERRHRMAVTIILATFFFLVVSSVLVVVVTLTQTTFHNAPTPSNRTVSSRTPWDDPRESSGGNNSV